MLLKVLHRKIAFQWVLLVGLLGYSIYIILTQAQLANEQGAAFLYKNFAQFFSQYLWLGKGIVAIILLLQILLLQHYFRKNEFTAKTSLLPACFYISILLLTKSLTAISPFFFTFLFFLVIISISYTAPSEKLKNNAFWVGALIALGTCFDISSIVLLILAIVTLFINHFSRIKEIGTLLFGFSLLYLYLFAYYFFTDNLSEWILTFTQLQILGFMNDHNFAHAGTLIPLIVLGILYLFLILKFKIASESKVVVQRKRIITFNTWSLLLIICLFISNSPYPNVLGYLFVPVAVYLSMLAPEKSPYFINEIITIAILLALWL
ncbi:MAG: DUF6427 family protein [Lentimicrobiaceae bacterium]|nr:DUF6427 family protein [Lentimicrobiaceae bacterium]